MFWRHDTIAFLYQIERPSSRRAARKFKCRKPFAQRSRHGTLYGQPSPILTTIISRRRKESKTIPFAQPIGKLFDAAAQFATDLKVDRGWEMPGVHIGTSAFTAAGWPGSFYPADLPARDYLSYYATKFDTVEVVPPAWMEHHKSGH